MPRIEKVRITGVRYDKMKKHYENTIFDFLNETEPHHALLTLVNGGGKGMLLQMIFQALMPLTTWGKNGENHIDALFYNEKQQFDPYTFHVALEWRLDTEPAEWLVTGICVTARKSGRENDEIETEPQYFLYTSKYRKPEDWMLETLPLYDEEQKETTSYEDWENWLKKHKQHFHFYSKSKQTAYYQYLSTYGIEKMEWKHMKEINRDEGGIEHYFKKGLDNFGLFHNLIIPEISSYLEEDQEENLVKIFRDNSIIAQKLPKLLKREETYQLILGKLIPINTVLVEGQSLEVEGQEHHDRANYLYFGMEEQKQTYQYDLEKWQKDKQDTEKKQADFLWQKDNLEFAEECRSYKEKSTKIETSQDGVELLDTEQRFREVEKQTIEVDIALKDYNESKIQLEAIESRIQFLENAQNLKEEKDQIADIEQQLSESWQSIESEIQSDIEKFNTLERSMNKEIKVFVSQMELEQNELNKVNAKLSRYTHEIKTHNQKAMKMEQTFGRDVNREPELVLKRITKELQELEMSLEELQQEVAKRQIRMVKVGELKGECNTLIKGKKDELAQVEKKKLARLEEERSFHKQWCNYYLVHQEFSHFSEDDWIDKADKLKMERDQIKYTYDSTLKDYWYHQLDTALVNNDYWVANNDVRKMVERLAEEGIAATYGTQLIQEFSAEEQAQVMERYPLLAYGIVVHQHDWNKKVDQSAFQLLLSHSPVPIFIRERMNQEYTMPFEIVTDQGISMAFNKEQWIQWKEKLTDLTDGFTTDLEKIMAKLDEVECMIEKVKTLSVITFQEILHDEEAVTQQLEELMQKSEHLQAEILSMETDLGELRKRIKQTNQEYQSTQKKQHELERWVSEHQQFLEYQELKSEAQTKKIEYEIRLESMGQQRHNLVDNLNKWEKSFNVWKINMQRETRDLQEIFPSIFFPTLQSIIADTEETPRLRNSIFDVAGPMVKQWHFLQQKINSADSELASERTTREYQFKDHQKIKARLNQLDVNWTARIIPVLPKEILNEKLKNKEAEIQKIIQSLEMERGNVIGLNGQLIEVKKNIGKLEQQILKKHHRGAESWDEVNLDVKEHKVEEALKKIKEDLIGCQKIIADLGRNQQQLQNQQDILKTHLSSFKGVGEIPSSYREQIKVDPEKLIQQWIKQNKELLEQKAQYHKGFKAQLKDLSSVLQDEKIDAPLKQSMNQLIPQLESDSIRSGLSVISSVIEHIQHELLKLKEDKQKAENAQEIWVERAVFRVISIFRSLKKMVNRMKIKNKEGHSFPLVEIERLKEIETGDDEEYRRLLREHFTQTIEKLLESEESIENLSDSQLKKYIDDSQLVLVSLRNRYPKLAIYKPQTTNAFLYEKPRKHHYTDWETLNKGSKMEAKGSGGQLLAARTMIMMMIMTFKRQEHSNNWSVLITDNPFGQAVSAHILDPIFSIADILRFQWIVLAPPELIKLDVSRRFPVYWKLELSQQKQGEVIKEVLQHGGRAFDDVEFSLF
ncbi:hypothetical protein V7103_23230 [Neobacillus drentensis]|uniref:hypothetical protein n=1 Tax=Neobacillus drentensis TaxID=220684 RepID=UPI002FFEF08F